MAQTRFYKLKEKHSALRLSVSSMESKTRFAGANENIMAQCNRLTFDNAWLRSLNFSDLLPADRNARELLGVLHQGNQCTIRSTSMY
jgi:hypothetical protein